jgi:hypothetical protein
MRAMGRLASPWAGVPWADAAEAFRQGQYEKAVELFQASLHLGELNITWLNLGRALYKLGRCEEALAAYQSAQAAPRVQTPSPEQVDAKRQEYVADLKSCPGYLVMKCPTGAGPTMYSIDGQPPVRCAAEPVALPPGEHTVVAQGQDQGRAVTIIPMSQTTMSMPTAQTPPVSEGEQPPTQDKDLGLLVGLRWDISSLTGGDYETTGTLEGITFSGKDSYSSEAGIGGDIFAEYDLLSFLSAGLQARYLTGLKPSFGDSSTQLGARQFHQLDLGAYLNLWLPVQGVYGYALGVGGGAALLMPQDTAPEAMDSFTGYYSQATLEARIDLKSMWILLGTNYQYFSATRAAQQDGVSLDEALTGSRLMFSLGLAWKL